MHLTVEGTWYGGGCQTFSGVYSDLGTVSNYNYTLKVTGSGICGGYTFIVVNSTGSTIYTSTSPAQNVALRFDGNPPPTTYDCLNGNCVMSTQYSTPGQYASLSDCQAVCANGGACANGKQCVDPTNFCPNGKVCIDQDEYTNIQGLISKINSEVC